MNGGLTSSKHGLCTHTSVVQHLGTLTNNSTIFHSATVEDCARIDDGLVSDNRRSGLRIFGGVNHDAVTDCHILAYRDGVIVTTQHGTVPNGGLSADFHLTNNSGRGSDERTLNIRSHTTKFHASRLRKHCNLRKI